MKNGKLHNGIKPACLTWEPHVQLTTRPDLLLTFENKVLLVNHSLLCLTGQHMWCYKNERINIIFVPLNILYMSKEIQFSLTLFFSRSLFISEVSSIRYEKERTKEMEDEVKKVNVPPVQSLPLGHKSPLFSVFYLSFSLLLCLKWYALLFLSSHFCPV